MKAGVNANDLKRLILATQKFTENSGRRPIFQYIRLDFCKEFSKVTAVAIDGYRMSIENAVCSEIDEDFTAYIKSDIPKFSSKYSVAIVEVSDKTCFIEIDGCIAGYKQPTGDAFDYKQSLSDMTKEPPSFRIGFNGNLLIQALQAAKSSCGDSFRKAIVLEFRGERDPILLRTNKEDVKVVLPIRIKEE